MVHEVSRETWVMTAWRFYDVEKKRMIDDLRDYDSRQTWTEEGPTEDEARSQLPSQTEAVRSVSRQAGVDYARRIAPTYMWVSRAFYGRRDSTLSAARPLVKSGNWDDAIALWKPMLDSGDPTLRGKALYNMALHAEVFGDLEEASSLLSEAVSALPKGRVYRYQATINQRIADQAALREQLPGSQ
jgi:tetratricopeptide (TPR) repeat protein